MSENKFKFFEVTNTTIVRANNKTDAEAVSRRLRGANGTTLASETSIEVLSATEAKALAEEML